MFLLNCFQGQKTDGYITYVMKYVDMLLHFNVKPILVFDGRNLPSKSETEKKRRENRAKYRKMALVIIYLTFL
jgi:exonuclease-1